jgi:hypothetical protein
METTLKYFGVLIPNSLNLLIQLTSFFNRDASVTGRLGDMHINEDGSKTMGDRDQKIIHRWNHESQKSTWTTESCKNNRSGWFFKV